MAAKIIELADAVKALLVPSVGEAGGTVEREYVPRLKLENLEAQGLTVTVVPRTVETARLSRVSIRRDLVIDVAVQKRTATTAESDSLVRLADSMADLLWAATSPVASVALLGVQQTVYSPEHMDQQRVFTSVLTATYREGREP
jgi:hypothetical protein